MFILILIYFIFGPGSRLLKKKSHHYIRNFPLQTSLQFSIFNFYSLMIPICRIRKVAFRFLQTPGRIL